MYNEFFGFRSAPFSVTPDSEVYYTNASLEEAFATVKHGITERKGLVVVTGDVGTGKTTLLHRFLRELGPGFDSAFIFNTQLTFDDLLRLALEDFGLSTATEDRLSRLAVLNRYLTERLKKNRTVCLVVDEAQNLSVEALGQLRLLLNAETPKEKLLQIVLAGQPELEDKLEQPSVRDLRQRVFAYARLRPLRGSEIENYIGYRLEAAGCRVKALFQPDALSRIAFFSAGVPRIINIICDNALISAYALSQRAVTAELINEVAADLRLAAAPHDTHTPRGVEGPKFKTNHPAALEESRAKNFSLSGFERHDRPVHAPATFAPGGHWAVVGQRHTGLKTGAFLTAILFGAAGTLVYSQTARKYFSSAGANLEELVTEFTRGEPEHVAEPNVVPAPPQAEMPARTNSPEPVNGSTSSDRADDQRTEAAVPRKNIPIEEPEKRFSPPRKTEKNPRKEIPLQANNPEFALQRAIQNRGIAGVSVSFVNGTAYLEGAVATERQKQMAERAAHTVPEVRVVRNRIEVR